MDKNGEILRSLVFAAVCLAAAIVLTKMGFVLFAVLACGLALGYVLQRSRFCIASAFTDLLLFKDGALFRALLLFILVSTLGFSLVELKVGREGYVIALGWRTVIGAVLFGCGMVLAGGCAAGTLMRLSEGYVLFVPVLAGLIIGSTLGAFHYNYWGSPQNLSFTYFLPDLIGWTGAVFLQVLCLVILWFLIRRWENR